MNGPASTAAPRRFAALDFETADYGRDSACALSIVIVEDDTVRDTWTRLIRPPRHEFVFTYLHGIAWAQVKNQPSFGELWQEAAQKLSGLDFIAAHNAAFDRSVLQACCDASGVQPLRKPFVCTVKVARAVWQLRPATLADVCRHLSIPLNHHNAESDALACARILIAASRQGYAYEDVLKRHSLRPARREIWT
jgi:DNA polymerase-3 subunit epsilon